MQDGDMVVGCHVFMQCERSVRFVRVRCMTRAVKHFDKPVRIGQLVPAM